MKTLENEKGLDLKPCLKCTPVRVLKYSNLDNKIRICPCPNHAGEWTKKFNKEKNYYIITHFNCENRKMHVPPRKSQDAPETQKRKT